MLAFISLISVGLLVLNGRNVAFLISSFWFLVYFVSSFNMSFNSAIYLYNAYNIIDEIGLFMVILTLFILVMAYIYSLPFGENKTITIVFFSLLVFCFQVFTTNNLFVLYFFYEASLIPILYIIVKWGSYPERSIRAIIILSYTLLFRAPFLVIIVFVF